MNEEEEGEGNEDQIKEVKEDAVVKSVEFRLWRGLSKSNQNVLDLLCELVALASSNEDDQEYEDVEGEDEETKQSS